jgi:hypothetical protein
MAKLKKVEPVAFVLLFFVLCYALVVLAPHSALHDSMAETLAGGATVAVAVALLVLRRLPKRRVPECSSDVQRPSCRPVRLPSRIQIHCRTI